MSCGRPEHKIWEKNWQSEWYMWYIFKRKGNICIFSSGWQVISKIYPGFISTESKLDFNIDKSDYWIIRMAAMISMIMIFIIIIIAMMVIVWQWSCEFYGPPKCEKIAKTFWNKFIWKNTTTVHQLYCTNNPLWYFFEILNSKKIVAFTRHFLQPD